MAGGVGVARSVFVGDSVVIEPLGVAKSTIKSNDGESIRMCGDTSDAILSVQDGTGRIQLYWNSTVNDTNNKYLVSGEEAGRWEFDPAVADELFTCSSAPAGTAGNNITWTERFKDVTPLLIKKTLLVCPNAEESFLLKWQRTVSIPA